MIGTELPPLFRRVLAVFLLGPGVILLGSSLLQVSGGDTSRGLASTGVALLMIVWGAVILRGHVQFQRLIRMVLYGLGVAVGAIGILAGDKLPRNFWFLIGGLILIVVESADIIRERKDTGGQPHSEDAP